MAGYESQNVGDGVEISTMPEKVPAPWLLVAIPGTLLVLLALSTGFIYGVIAAGFVYGAMYLLMHSKQATQFASRRNFAFRRAGLKWRGTTFRRTRFTG